MSSNLPLVRRSRRVLPWSGGLKLEINIPSQRIRAKWKGGLINEGGIISSEYGTCELRATEYGPLTNYSELQSWSLWTCAPSTHLNSVSQQLLRCSQCL